MIYQGRHGTLRPASALTTLVMVPSILVPVLMAVVLARLHHFEGVPLPFVILATLTISGGSWSLTAVMAGQPDPAGLPVPKGVPPIRRWTAVLLTVIELISLSGVLARMALNDNRFCVMETMSAATLCVIGFFAVIQVVSWFPVNWLLTRHQATAALVVITAVLAVSAAPGRASVLPDDAGLPSSPAPLLAISVLGLLIAALTAWPEGGPPAWRAVVPTFTALVFFALTRDMSLSIALLAGGLAVLIVGNQPAHREVGNPARRRLATSLRSVGIAVVLFAVLSWPVMLAGQALGAPDFDPWHAFGYSAPRPATFFYGQGMGVGPGWRFRFVSGAGGDADVLATIGRETGFLGLLLLLAAYIVVFGVLVLLATKIAKGTAPAALAWGLITLLLTRFTLAVATLVFPAQVALGEGPPLLADSWVGYPTALLSVAIIVGLAWRAAYRAPAARPVQNVANPGNDLS